MERSDCHTMKVEAAEFRRACIRIAACAWYVVYCLLDGRRTLFFRLAALSLPSVSSGRRMLKWPTSNICTGLGQAVLGSTLCAKNCRALQRIRTPE